jgi:hypothetical protein
MESHGSQVIYPFDAASLKLPNDFRESLVLECNKILYLNLTLVRRGP